MGAARLPPLLPFRIAASISARLSTAASRSISSVSHSQETSDRYKSALKIQRPTVVGYKNILPNYVTLIGTIEYPLKPCNSRKLGFHTVLRVNESPGASRHLRVMLNFWHEMAEISARYLKPDDLVYVSGRLESYTKDTEVGKLESCYQVNVKELNYVAQQHLGSTGKNLENHEPESEPELKLKPIPKLSFEDRKQRRRDRLHLWHIFFASPHEWWDNRRHKLNPKAPDFVHKDTRETLWLRDNDPPWVGKQLQLYDSTFGKQNPGVRNYESRLSPMVFNDA